MSSSSSLTSSPCCTSRISSIFAVLEVSLVGLLCRGEGYCCYLEMWCNFSSSVQVFCIRGNGLPWCTFLFLLWWVFQSGWSLHPWHMDQSWGFGGWCGFSEWGRGCRVSLKQWHPLYPTGSWSGWPGCTIRWLWWVQCPYCRFISWEGQGSLLRRSW